MAVFNNTNPSSRITSVEFSDLPAGNLMFFHVSGDAEKEAFKQLLASDGQQTLSETKLGSQFVLATQGNKTEEQIFEFLAQNGEKFSPQKKTSKFNPWAWRGGLSVVGQVLQIFSARASSKGLDAAVFGFAVPNLIANGINFVFGSQKSADKYHLHALKTDINQMLSLYVGDTSLLPSPNSISHKKDKEKQSAGKIAANFIRKYSVFFGEIGLRILGSFSLAFPYNKWKESGGLLLKGKFLEAYNIGKNPDKATFWVGIFMLIGKFIGFGAKTADPYAPNQGGWLNNIREKYIFKASTVVEGGATAYMMYDRIKNKKIILNKGKPNAREVPDYFSFAGNAVFDVGYGIRLFAPFGTKVMDMRELYSHTVKGLSLVPQDKIPEAAAELTAKILESLGPKATSFEQVYREITGQLYEDYRIAIPGPQEINNSTVVSSAAQATSIDGKHAQRVGANRPATLAQMVDNSRGSPAAVGV